MTVAFVLLLVIKAAAVGCVFSCVAVCLSRLGLSLADATGGGVDVGVFGPLLLPTLPPPSSRSCLLQ